MNKIFKRYNSLLVRFPILSQSIQTGVLMGSGDFIAQTAVEKKSADKLDFARTGKFTLIGLGLVGPTLRIWYGKMDKFFGTRGKMTVVKKVIADQMLFAPVFLFIIMVTINLSDRCTRQELESTMKLKYPEVLKSNYYLWPGVQLLNFYLVPLDYRVPFVQIVGLFWNTYLSWKMNDEVIKR